MRRSRIAASLVALVVSGCNQNGIVTAGDAGGEGTGRELPPLVPAQDVPIPDPVPTWVQLGAGNIHSCARRSDGEVRCWGGNDRGQLGLGTSGYEAGSTTPVPVLDLGASEHVSGGDDLTCAVRAGGGVSCWGSNDLGQLGAGDPGPGELATLPVPVVGLENVVAIVAGANNHACALDTPGRVHCWGGNASGQLGNGTNESSNVPTDVVGVNDAVALAAGYAHSCALRAGGTVVCWGVNSLGRLGNGTLENANAPTTVLDLTDAAAIAVGATHSCAVRQNGSVVCWGENGHGELGDGTWMGYTTSPVASLITEGAVEITAGVNHSCVLREDETVACWGLNNSGQLGIGLTSVYSTNVPTPVVGLAGVRQVEAGDYHTCAVTDAGAVYCWGSNYRGQLGNENPAAAYFPVQVAGLE